MIARDIGDIDNIRMLTLKQAAQYSGIGLNTCRAWCDEIGATRKFSDRVVRFDKQVIDEALSRK